MKYDFDNTKKNSKYDFDEGIEQTNPTSTLDTQTSKTPFAATKTGIALNTVTGIPKAVWDIAKYVSDKLTERTKEIPSVLEKQFSPKGIIKVKEGKLVQDEERMKEVESLVMGFTGNGPVNVVKKSFDKLTKFFVKETDPNAINTVVKGLGLSDDLAEEASKRLSVATTKKEVGQIINEVVEKIPQKTTPVTKLTEAIETSKPLRGDIELAQSQERAKRFAAAERVQRAVGGEAGYKQGLGELKGSLLEKQPSFTPPREIMKQPEIDTLFNAVTYNNVLNQGEQLTAKRGLTKLLNGHVPTPSELAPLEEVFGSDMIKAIYDKRPVSQKIWDVTKEVIADIPRALMTTIDMSGTLRQGIVLGTRNPVKFSKAFAESFKGMISNNYFEKALDSMKLTPEYKLANEVGLAFSDPRKLFGHREEYFLSNLAEKIPGIGRLVKASNRAYVGMSNSLRFSVFNDLAGSFAKEGVDSKRNLEALADFVNTATGRGSLGQLERHATLLSKVLFAPKYMMSRLQFFNPVWYAKQPAPVRKEALKTFGSFVGTVTSMITLAKMGGADIEVDPRSSNFGKMKTGNTYYDLTAGFGQYIRLFTQLITGEKKTQTGGIQALGGNKPYDQSRLDVLSTVARGKLAPLPSAVTDILAGKNVVGKPITPAQAIGSRYLPLYIQDMKNAIEDQGPQALFSVGLPAFFGVGVQTYPPAKKKKVKYQF